MDLYRQLHAINCLVKSTAVIGILFVPPIIQLTDQLLVEQYTI